jgi:hypothetical protein
MAWYFIFFNYFKLVKIFAKIGWSWKCLEDWSDFFKLSIPGLLMLLIEWLSYEIGTLLCSMIIPMFILIVTIICFKVYWIQWILVRNRLHSKY